MKMGTFFFGRKGPLTGEVRFPSTT
jgi:hypothetical protein